MSAEEEWPASSVVCVACALSIALDPSFEGALTPAPAEPLTPDGAGRKEEEEERVGPYKLHRVIGEGGMGLVYEATQDEPVRRRVALKRIKLGMDSVQVLSRFESERQALALMSHPNIAQVYDAGTSADSRPYFAMEYIEGPWITHYCDALRLGLRPRLELFLSVCRGIEHAHQKGIIHRDVKPSNVLVRNEEAGPVPKIIDFGVAKAIGTQLSPGRHLTRLGQSIGTPEYMSPEQAGTASYDVDTRADVYSLGVLLFELLTGGLPFESSGDESELRRRIREDDPPTCTARLAAFGPQARDVASKRSSDPASLARQLRGDIDWITKKALEKDRSRRYGSPAELAADLVRHMNDEPVVAGPPSAAYRAGKFVRRHRVGVTAAMIGLAGVLGFALVMAIQTRRIAAERAASDKVSQFLANMLGTVSPQAMGGALWKTLHDGAAEARRRRGAPDAQVNAALVSLDDSLTGVNATDTAMRLLDEQVLARAGQTIEREMGSQPRIAGTLEHTLGETYFKLGLYDQAETHAARAVKIRRDALGADHPDTLLSMNSLATVYSLQGKFKQAEELDLETLEARRRVLGPDDPATLATMQGLAVVYRRQSRLEESEELTLRTLEARKRVLGPDHPDTLKSMQFLVTLYDRQERYEEAEALGRKTLAATRAALGPENPDALGAANDLANVLMRARKFVEAEALHRETLEIRRTVLGRDHPATLGSMNNLANVLWSVGRLPEAEALLSETLEIRRRVLRMDHPETASSMHNLANVYKDEGRYDLAERLYIEAVESRRRVLRADHPDTLDDMYAIGCVAALRKDRKQALHWLTEAIDHGYREHADSGSMSEDADLKILHGDPAFEALLVRARKDR